MNLANELRSEVQTLSRLGLSVNQSKVYLFLAKSGTATARIISEKTGVARQDIYRLTQGLETYGLVEKTITLPVRFKAIPMNQALCVLKDRRNKETIELWKKTEELAKKFENGIQNHAIEQNNCQFLIIPEKDANMRKRLTLIHNTQNCQSVISSQKRLHAIPHVMFRELLAALRRNVKIRLIREKPEDMQASTGTVKKFVKTGNLEIRYLPSCPAVSLAIFDNNEALIVTDSGAGLTESPALWTNNSSLVKTLQEYFEILWLTAIRRDDPIIADLAAQ